MGQVLYENQKLISLGGYFTAELCNDGNFIVYKWSIPLNEKTKTAIWSSNTLHGAGPFKLIMNTNSNLVMYDANNNPVWFTSTYITDANRLKIQADGNLVLLNDKNLDFVI